jgi:hypothetical protein
VILSLFKNESESKKVKKSLFKSESESDTNKNYFFILKEKKCKAKLKGESNYFSFSNV